MKLKSTGENNTVNKHQILNTNQI